MKYFTGETVFQFTWDQIVTAFWSRYPNPYSKHVLSEDVVSREVVGNKLFTKRLLCKSGKLPRWGERYFGGLKFVYIIEESVVDLPTQTLTTYTRNIGKQHWMSIEEKCIYTKTSECDGWVECRRQAWIDSGVKGLTRVIASYGMSRFRNNLKKTVDGFNHVLTSLYTPETDATEMPKKSSEKLKESAKKATEMAKNVKSKVPRRELNSP